MTRKLYYFIYEVYDSEGERVYAGEDREVFEEYLNRDEGYEGGALTIEHIEGEDDA